MQHFVRQISINSIIAALLLSLIASHANALPSYKKLDIRPNQVFSPEAFPYDQFLICINQQTQSTRLTDYMAQDQRLKTQIRKIAAEATATLYRYHHQLPHKDRFYDSKPLYNTPQQSQPFTKTSPAVHYTVEYLQQDKGRYRYGFRTQALVQQMFRRGLPHKPFWLLVNFDIYRASSDYDYQQLPLHGHFFMVGINLEKIDEMKTEKQAYQAGYRHAKLYYLDPSSLCKP